jgi:nucleoside-triphosphatase THEP1/SpoVK/Ycf46/Vps4 family AAA+-type ATPase
MWIRYSYDVGSMSEYTKKFGFPVPSEIIKTGKIEYNQIIQLLKDDYAHLSENSTISCYFNTIKAYKRLRETDFLDITEDSYIELLIKDCIDIELGYLIDKFNDLEQRIWGLEQRLANQEEVKSNIGLKQNIDIAMLYAAPLIRREGVKIRDCDNWNLDFSKEKNKLIDALKKNEIRASILFEIATLENLSAVLESKPKIIHISCHGYYKYKDKLRNEFVLAFESSKQIGMHDEVTPERLKKILQPHSNYKGIVIVSACYSQAIEQVLLEAGINVGITIHKECKISDEAAIEFSVIFYRNLFKGKTIRQAFEEAKNGVSSMQTTTPACCCTHNHSPNCLAKKKGHSDHVPNDQSCSCDNKNNFSIHKVDCKWAADFNHKYQSSRTPTEEEKASGTWVVCCCPPPLLPHTEAMKFKLLKKNLDALHKPIFTEEENRDFLDTEVFDIALKPAPVNSKIIGRGNEMKEILKLLSGKNRILILHGRPGIGKTLLVKHVAKYGFERKMFKNGVVYLDIKGKKFVSSINQMLAKKLNTLWEKSNEHLERLIDSMHILIIIDNIDSISNEQLKDLSTKISSFHERTQYPKFCVVLDKPIAIDQAEEYEIKELTDAYAGKLIKYLLEPSLYQTVKSHLSGLIVKIDRSPSSVLNIIALIKEIPIEEIFDQILSYNTKKFSQPGPSAETQPLKLFLTYLEERDSQALGFLRMLSYFPAGVYKTDLSILWPTENTNYNDILKIISNQQSYLIDLSSKILVVPDSLKTCLLNKDKGQKPIMYYEYISMLAQCILISLMKQTSTQRLEIMKSLTNIFFNPYPKPNILSELSASCLNSETSPLQMFKEMKKNFMHFLTNEAIEDIHTDEVNKVSQFVFEICICCARIYLILGKRRKAESIIKETKIIIKNLGHNMLKVKLKMTLAAISYEFSPSNQMQGNNEKLIKVVKKILLNFDHKGPEVSDYLAETKLLIALISMKNPLSSVSSEIDQSLNLAEEIFTQLNLKAELSRLYLAKFQRGNFSKQTVKNLLFAKETFSEINFKGLLEKTLYCLGVFYFGTEEWFLAEGYLNEGKELSSQLKDRKMEINFKEKLDETFGQIRKRSKNVIAILRAYPIIYNDEGYNPNNNLFCTHFSEFKENLANIFIQEKKIICLKFEIGTKENIELQVKEGCRVLHISTVMPEKNALVLEKPDFSADVLSFDDLKKLFGDRLKLHGIKLIVLAMPFSLQLGEFFHKELLVPSVICFDFEEFPLFKYLTQLQLLFEKAIEKFCEKFYHHIIEGEVIKEAWKISKQFSDQFIKDSNKFFDYMKYEDSDIEELYRGKGPFLIGDGDSALFTNVKHDILANETVLQSGKPLNMSSTKPPTNIVRKANSFVGRYKVMYEILKILKEDGIVHVAGQQGIGKTKLIEHIGVYLNGRSHYKLGIFYQSLKGKSSLDTFIEDLQKEGIALTREESGIKESLYKKDILLMIDDCDSLIREFKIPFLNLIKKIHGEYKINMIVASEPALLDYECRRVELKPLEPLESAALLLAVLQRTLPREEVKPYHKNMDIAQDLTESNLLKDCMNIPSKILKLAAELSLKSFDDLETERRAKQNYLLNMINKIEPEFIHSRSVNVDLNLEEYKEKDRNSSDSFRKTKKKSYSSKKSKKNH